MTAARTKGTRAESAVVTYLQSRGWPHAERRALTGGKDRGDLAGVYGIAGAVVLEVKSCKTVSVPAWLREALVEQENANAAVAAVVAKPRGVGDTRVGEWHVHMTFAQLCDLLEQAGYR